MQLYLILMSTRSLLSRTIRLYTRDEFNHASIALSPDLSDIVSFGRKNINNPFIGGYVNEQVHSEFFSGSQCSIYKVELTSEQYHSIRNQLKYFEENKEYLRYNLLGLIGVATKIEIKRKDAYFCSQFIGKVLEESKVSILPKNVAFLTPTDLSRLPEFTKIYSGSLTEYLNSNETNIAVV